MTTKQLLKGLKHWLVNESFNDNQVKIELTNRRIPTSLYKATYYQLKAGN